MTEADKKYPHAAQALQNAKRLVIKVGSALLMQGQSGALNKDWLAALTDDIAAARQAGKDIVLVSSGAIALGRGALALPDGDLTLEQSQAAAACGQIALAQAWQTLFDTHGLKVAQILLTYEDTEKRRRYLNARATLNTLLAQGVIPIINENDTVATQEIRYGDNDRLAARVAGMISADGLVLFSDVDGLYTAPEKVGQTDAHIAVIEDINDDIAAMAGESTRQYSRGGMITKLEAARLATNAGAFMVLASGHSEHGTHLLTDLQNGQTACSLFVSHASPHTARKNWIAGSLKNDARVHIDAGAVTALENGKSLLPIGVTKIEGRFERGDCVAILAPNGQEVARGLIEHDSQHAAQFKGQRTGDIQAENGDHARRELIHRDNLVLTSQSK